jgi:agmatinase
LNKPDYIRKDVNYEGCTDSFEDATTVLIGAGYDGTSTYRSGSRYAPRAIRKNTILSQEDYSPYLKKDLKDQAIHDFGNIQIPHGNREEVLKRIEQVSEYVVRHNKKPFFIGGEHLITLPAIKPLIQKYPDLHVIQLDAHLDLMDVLFGERFSHGTVMRRIYELLEEPKRIFQVGIRSGNQEEFIFSESNTKVFLFNTESFIPQIKLLEGKTVYLTVDLDVFDPSLIPGTGTPEAGGIFFPEFINLLKHIKHLNIVGADLVELSPPIDPTNISTIIASQILRELLLIL